MRLFTRTFLFVLISHHLLSQPQVQGEFHRTIIRKTETERRKAKAKEWFGAGVIMFAHKDIPREGKIKEVEPMLDTKFKGDEKFVGRIYLPRNIGRMDQNIPDAILYKLFVDNGPSPSIIDVPLPDMPDPDWSSWLIDFPDKFKEAMGKIPSGSHTVRVELWSGYLVPQEELEQEVKPAPPTPTANTTGTKPAPKRPAPKPRDVGPHGRLWALGEFTIEK